MTSAAPEPAGADVLAPAHAGGPVDHVVATPPGRATRLWRGQSADDRHEEQRERLLRAAAAVANRVGYADATASAISTEAKMSKATFYDHFANRDACFTALVHRASEVALEAFVVAAREAGTATMDRQRAGLRAFMRLLAAEPAAARATLVEAVNGGPDARQARAALMELFATNVYEETRRGAERDGGPKFASHIDALAHVGAIVELSVRHLEHGSPTLAEIEDTSERIIRGLLVD